ncbi:hypothetical protein QBC36DRAFT_228813 [Triangularia setosa]|uniref:Uncharacterized protein n=1 Tax=Triangularia setosa TaxID=2587417 RepID=A0AAN6WI84_9PEZI|nr:hypothetical protein QBC36DRAFT_228813 [Podospora setosa]
MIPKNLFLVVGALLSGLTAAGDQAVACAEANNKIQPRNHNEADLTTTVTQTQLATLTFTLNETPTCAEPVATTTGADGGGIIIGTALSTLETTDTLTVTSTITSGTSTLTATVVGNGSTYNVPSPSTSASWSTSTTSASEPDDADETPSIESSVTPFVPPNPSSTATTDNVVTDTSTPTETSTETASTYSSEATVSAAAMPMILRNDLMIAVVAAAMVIAA